MTIITDAQLDAALLQIFGGQSLPNLQFQKWCELQYLYGMRYNETKQPARWALQPSGDYSIACEKGNNHRLILAADMPDMLLYWLQTGCELWDTCRERTCQRLILYYNILGNVYTSKHGLTSSLFRYNRIKIMHNDGQSDSAISTFIGDSDLKNIQGYYNAVLWH